MWQHSEPPALSGCLERLERTEQAVGALRRALALQPGSVDKKQALASALALRAYELSAEKRYRAAVKLNEEAVRLDGTKAGYWGNLGLDYQALGRQAEADAALKRAARLKRAAGDSKR